MSDYKAEIKHRKDIIEKLYFVGTYFVENTGITNKPSNGYYDIDSDEFVICFSHKSYKNNKKYIKIKIQVFDVEYSSYNTIAITIQEFKGTSYVPKEKTYQGFNEAIIKDIHNTYAEYLYI